MLKQRLVTAALLAPLAVAGIFWLPTTALSWLLGAIVLLAAWEWTLLMGLRKVWQRGLYLFVTTVLLALLIGIKGPLLLLLLNIVMLLWCVAIAWIFFLNRTGPLLRRDLPWPLSALIGIWLLLPMWSSLILLHGSGTSGPVWVLLMMVLIWGADSGAYFAGRRWGKRKLAINLSPGKTWEGVSGGAVLALLLVLPLTVSLVGWQEIERGLGHEMNPVLLWFGYALLCAVTIAVSVCGDLFESVAKRHAGVKDSGKILPGHGGVLDRIDSLTAAAPCFVLGLLWLGLIPGATP